MYYAKAPNQTMCSARCHTLLIQRMSVMLGEHGPNRLHTPSSESYSI